MIPALLMVILTAYTPYLLGLWELMEFQLLMMKYAQPNLSQHMWKTLIIHYQQWCVYTGHYISTLLFMYTYLSCHLALKTIHKFVLRESYFVLYRLQQMYLDPVLMNLLEPVPQLPSCPV